MAGTGAASTGEMSLAPEQLGRVLDIETRSFTQPWSLADFEWLARDEEAVKVGLWHGDELVGYAIGVPEAGAVFHLASLAVDPPWRRRGWGSRLLAAVLDRARQRGCRRCRLEVRRSNVAALALYRRSGFTTEGLRRRFYTSPVEDAWLLTRSLAGADADHSRRDPPRRARWPR